MNNNGGHLAIPGPMGQLLVAAATGGLSHWSYLALTAAQHPEVHEAMRHAGQAGYRAASVAATSAAEWYDYELEQVCIGRRVFIAVVVALIVIIFGLALGLCCSLSALAGGGVGWLLARHAAGGSGLEQQRSPRNRSSELLALDALAREVVAGDAATRALAARRVGTDTASLEAWAASWLRAMRGPRRTGY